MNDSYTPHNGTEEAGAEFLTEPRRRRHLIRRVLLVMVLIVVVGLSVIFYLVRSEPSHWKEFKEFARITSAEEMENMASGLEKKINALSELVSEQGMDDESLQEMIRRANKKIDDAVTLSELDGYVVNRRLSEICVNVRKQLVLNINEINAMLLTRLDEWALDRGFVVPKEMRSPMFNIDGDQMVLAFEWSTPRYSQVISGYFNVNIREDGMAEMVLDEFLIGLMPVPADSIASYMSRKGGGSQMRDLGQWLEKFQYIEFRPVMELEHRRRARVIDYRVLPDGIELTLQIQDYRTYKRMNHQLAEVVTE